MDGKERLPFCFPWDRNRQPPHKREIKKGLNLAQLPEKIALLKRNGINVGGFFMIGFPSETREEIDQTVNLALSLDIDVAAISVFVPLPGSELFEQLPSHITRRFTDCAFQNACNDLSQVSSGELHAIAAKTFFRMGLKPSRTLFLPEKSELIS
ncbi:MAG: hypothetical protein WCG31_09030 [Deltaproteobacteria bacterium]